MQLFYKHIYVNKLCKSVNDNYVKQLIMILCNCERTRVLSKSLVKYYIRYMLNRHVGLLFYGVEFAKDIFSARCNIYISRLCYDVCLSVTVTEVHWCIIANLGFKFRSNLPRIAVAVHAGASTELFVVQWALGKGSSPGIVEGSSCAMLAAARPSCFYLEKITLVSI